MEPKVKKVKSYSTSEASQKRALAMYLKDRRSHYYAVYVDNDETMVLEFIRERDQKSVAIFDLRDCFRKRQPLKGVTKEVAKLMRKRR